MLINVVKDSVLKCFCHTCSVNSAITGRHFQKKPISKKINKKQPRCKQPKRKRLYHATEIRCEEKSRGGMCYEMILADPIADKPEQSNTSPRPKSVTVDDINMKLLQAEERRKMMEASRQATISERLARLEEANRKREEANIAFITATQLALEDKLDAFSSNRESHLNGLKAKISEHLTSVESVRRQLEAQSEELREAINSKLNSAQENRDEHTRKLMDKLKEHEDHAQRVRLGHHEAIRQLEEKITTKLNVAEANRMSEMMKKLEVLREHSNKINDKQEAIQKREMEMREVRQQIVEAYDERIKRIEEERESRRHALNVSAKVEQVQEARLKEEERQKKEVLDRLEQKLENANKNREEQLEKIRKSQEESDRRAEIVRANKERLLAEEKLETASSG